jgi:23S rRNA (adenine2503-C2)-methyltransferase
LEYLLNKLPVYGLLFDELTGAVERLGLPKYRSRQIQKAVFDNRVTTFSDVTTLPAPLRTSLEEKFVINSLKTVAKQESKDGTTKLLLETADNARIEAVMIPENRSDETRRTLCISTQVGCGFDCAFCATGKLPFKRNLSTEEIISQYITAERELNCRITNLVFMGMGEPMLNFDNVIKSLRIICENALLSKRKITISTSGVVSGILRLAEEYPHVKLAVSLHASSDIIRKKIIPASDKWSISELLSAAEVYYNASGLPITYEYILFEGLNDSRDDVGKLARICRRMPSKVNLMEYHDISFATPEGFASELRPSPKDSIRQFADNLRALGVNAFVRSSAGDDIKAACGQLAFGE